MADELGDGPGRVPAQEPDAGKDEFPYQTKVALLYDSGNYEPALDKALAKIGYASLRAEQAAAAPRAATSASASRPTRGVRPRALEARRQPRGAGRPVGERASSA